MTIEELLGIAGEVWKFALEDLQKNGSINSTFHLFTRDKSREIYMTDGSINNSDFKTQFARMIRDRIAAGDIEGIVFICDTFFAVNLTPEQEKIRVAFGMNLEQAAAAGLCPKREALQMQVESPILRQVRLQEYKRGQSIEIMGKLREITEGVDGRVLSSKLGRWFESASSHGGSVQ